MVGAGKSLNLSRTPKEKEQTQKDLRDKITYVVEELKKDIELRLFLN